MKIGKGRRWTRVFFCRCTSNSQGLPKASPRADRARGRKGDRKTYCMYTAIHILSETDLPNKPSRAQGRAPRALSFWKTSVLFEDWQKKKLLEQLKLWSQWMKCGESWMPTCANMCHYAPTWANIAVCQLCRERQPVRNSCDGLNLTCLDQCHGVRSPGTSSSQGWRKRIFVQSKFGPWVYILVFAEGNFCRFG